MDNPLVKYYEVDMMSLLGKESREQRADTERVVTTHGKERGTILSINVHYVAYVVLLLPWRL